MTREEAIYILKNLAWLATEASTNKTEEAVDMAIKALEQEPCDKCKYFDGNSCQHYDYKVGYTQGYEDASNRFRQEPCEDAISREDAIQAVNDTLAEYIPYLRNDQIGIPLECARALYDLPSVTPSRCKGKGELYKGEFGEMESSDDSN